MVRHEPPSTASQIAEVLRHRYVRELPDALLDRLTPSTLATQLDDPYTRYLSPAQRVTADLADDGRYAGIGVAARTSGRELRLDGVTAGGPAERAGLAAGDVIIAVDGSPVRADALDAGLAALRGLPDTEVLVEVGHPDGTTSSVLLRRASIELADVETHWRAGAHGPVAVIAALRFDRGVAEHVRAALSDAIEHDATAVVLDLRGNGGGLVAEAAHLAAVFLPAGTPVLITSGAHLDDRTYRTADEPVSTTLPLAVLVDGDSASASEVVAGALRDAGRATVVGSTTFGKGVIQDDTELADGGLLRFTVAEYQTPAGHRIQGTGLAPDVVAGPTPDGGPVDLALAAALAELDRR